MLSNQRLRSLLLAFAISSLGTTAIAATFCPKTIDDLIAAILVANTNNEPDVINLGGKVFTITEVQNTTNGNNGLPVIQPDNQYGTSYSLTIEHGVIKRDMTITNLFARHFYIAPGAMLRLEDVILEYGSLANAPGLANNGGSILNFGSLSADNVAFAFNRAYSGGAIANGNSASGVTTSAIVISNSTFNLTAHILRAAP